MEKEVWIPCIFQGEDPAAEGKWVRYDNHGRMVKGWYACEAGVYYYDMLTGAMYKGAHEIEGRTYFFDELTGIRQYRSQYVGLAASVLHVLHFRCPFALIGLKFPQEEPYD